MENASKGKLHWGLWIAQFLLAVAFGMSGWMKTFTPIPELTEMMEWAGEFPVWLVRFIGISELTGAVGVVLPGLTGIKPKLTSLAAGGLCLVMILAALFHVFRAEFYFIFVNGALGALAGFVAWGRANARPFD